VTGLFAAWWWHHLRTALHGPLTFDDAYMFYRYAMNVRHGLGVSWNLDGVHTYGQTSPLWGVAVLLLSFLPMSMGGVLMAGSWVCSVMALVAMAWAVSRNAESRALARTWVVLPMVALPVVFSREFAWHATTGMETMLAMTLCAVYAGLSLLWQRGQTSAWVVGLAGWLLFLTRPESALLVLLVPLLMLWLLPGTSKKGTATLVAVFVACALLQMAACKAYFHTALPLSFTMKSQHAYAGYAKTWTPFNSAYEFFSGFRLVVLALVFFFRAKDWRLMAVYLVPAGLTFGYLLTVTQIMGFSSRFYLPYLPLFEVAALLAVDRRVAEFRAEPQQWTMRMTLGHGVAAGFALICCHGPVPIALARAGDRYMLSRLEVYDPVVLHTVSGTALPKTDYIDSMWGLTDLLVAPLPRGATVAASEVGYLGGHAPQVNIIDLAGLNDNQIALHGFQMDELLARRPDVIWMPHPDYSYQRGVMFTDPALLREYDVYAGAAGYGLAVRKDSPFRAQIMRQLRLLWQRLYPGEAMEGDLVTSVSWSGQRHRAEAEGR
jgi:hypothetical protein